MRLTDQPLPACRRLITRAVFACFVLGSLFVAGCSNSKHTAPDSGSFRQRLAAAKQVPNPAERARTLVHIAYQQAQARDEVGAEETFRLAGEACRQVEDRADRVAVLALLIQAQARSGFRAEASLVLEQALKEAAALDNPAEKARSLGHLALAQHALGNQQEAARSLQTAQELATAVLQQPAGDTLERATLLGRIATAAQKVGCNEQTAQLLELMHAQAEAETDPLDRVRLLNITAGVEHQLGLASQCEATFRSAEQAAEAIEPAYKKAFALAEVAERLSQCKQYRWCHQVLAKAEKTAEMIAERDLQQQALEKVRTLMLELPRPAS